MSERRIGRSIVAIVAGIAAGVIPTIGTDMVMHGTGVFPPFGDPVGDGHMAIALAYRIGFTIFGSYVVARLAPRHPMRLALISGFIGFVVSIAGAIATWNGGPAFGPKWYPLALIATAIPCAWAGAKLHEKQRKEGN